MSREVDISECGIRLMLRGAERVAPNGQHAARLVARGT
jgi:hypothetical protein